MDTETSPSAAQARASQALHDADVYVRENPVPAVLVALGIGLAIGLLARALSRPKYESRWEEGLHDAHDYWDSIWNPIARKGREAYESSSDAVHDVVKRARKHDVEDYTDSVAHWFRRMWNKCCD